MNLSLFSTLIRNLLQVNVLCTDNDQDALRFFEEKYCFHEALQPMFTVQALTYLMDSMQENTYYEIVDSLNVCLLFFRFSDQTFFVGPYVKTEYNEKKMQATLAENKMPASYAISLKLYYSAFPLLSIYHIQNTISACLSSFHGVLIDFSYRRLHGFHENIDAAPLFQTESIDYSELYRRYDIENHFLKMIETGNVEEVLTAYDETGAKSSPANDPYLISVYHNPVSGLAMVRALARKAAENSGLSVITIDEITQKAVQLMASSPDYREQTRITRNMLVELTQAVRNHLLHAGDYSAPIQRVIEYLSLNFSQEISLPHLADMVHFSDSHLSKVFKKETGTTISQYIAHLRCEHAAQMLRNTELSIQEISNYVGYQDNNYFVKVFKKQYNVTPSQFRSGKSKPSSQQPDS